MRTAMTKEEKEIFEKRFLEAMRKREKLVKAGRKLRAEARQAAIQKYIGQA
jgi:hypothetical protein